ncbi:MAG TPA: SUMF1/EgtB/PvdO family nonheme iron enzyme [Candidatus Acidoferrales bacterium]|nr:SUMF1/EgtB/PvdO family nonheme iron enzyme [Candidatus Acidoferrales bacterium]
MGATATTRQVRQQLAARLALARARTDELFGLVRPEAMYDRPIPERHRVAFYVGHLETFDWNLLGRNIFGLSAFHSSFDRLFAFGIDPVGGGLPDDQPADWPSMAEIEEYNARVRETLDTALAAASLEDPAVPLLHSGLILNVAIEHRLMHAETLAYMLHQLPTDRKFPEPIQPVPAVKPVTLRMVEIPTGHATLGLPREASGEFGWDNEFEEHTVDVPAFAIDAYMVTNREYLTFVREGGYEHRSLWPDGDWAWIQSSDIRQPVFWKRRADGWAYRTMFGEIRLPLDWPVYVSHAEASAYARWAGKKLPTEAQWHRAAYGTPVGVERAYPWGHQPPDALFGNFNFNRWDPTPVGAFPAGASAWGVMDLLGNGWEWTRTLFEPFPGFQAFPFYPGYSADFFDGKHYVMKGGTARTAACMLRRSFRNWFQPHYPYAYSGFRCVKD